MSEWFIVLAVTSGGQRIAVAPEQDGPVLATAATKEEAFEQAKVLSEITGLPLYNQDTEE